MPDDLDLELGNESLADRITASSRGESRTRTQSKSASSTSGNKRSSSPSADDVLNEQLVETFHKLAVQLQSRNDDELALAIETDAMSMAKGIMSLTHVVKWMRRPVVLFLGFLEPILAFWHVGGIFLSRWIDRRERKRRQHDADAITNIQSGSVTGV